MTRITSIWILCFTILPGIVFSGNSLDDKVDSIYNSLSDSEKISQLLWLKTDSIQKILHNENVAFGGVYLTNPVPRSGIKTIPVEVALEIGLSFRELGFGEDLPGIQSLNAITDLKLVHNYLEYIKNESLSNGYDHLVLPELSDSTKHLERILKIINEYDPDFYLIKDHLRFNPPERKKTFYESIVGKRAVVVDETLVGRYEKTLRRTPKSMTVFERNIIKHIKLLHEKPPRKSVNQGKLVHDLWAKSVIPFQGEHNILPIRNDTIGIWVENESSHLKKELEIYYGTVLNLKYDHIPLGVPIVVDARSNTFLATEYAYAFQAYNPIIWISSPSQLTNVNAAAVLMIPEHSPQLDFILSEMIYGSEGIEGQSNLPIPEFLALYRNEPVNRQLLLGYAQPEWAGMNEAVLDSIDLLAEEMIINHASPGAQILVAKNGKIVLNKAYGYLTYDSLIKVEKKTLYDLASLTKATSTLMAIMSLVDNNMIHLDSTISHYLPHYAETNKSDIRIRNILTHNAGLMSYIPFWKRSMRGDFLDVFYYKSKSAEDEDSRSYGYEPHPVMRDSLESWIRSSKVIKSEKEEYLYSDIGFMILHEIIEKVSGITLEEYIRREFFEPLRMSHTQFNPLAKGFEIYQIAPTEYDYYFREEQVWGNVHDRNAAIFGGVAGHAGLFSNARDLASLLQMILFRGQYGGSAYLSSGVISQFNRSQFKGNRRGLGWDKPGRYNPNISKLASKESFGHTGFTGTMLWADPKHDLIFIFLSNRIFPDSNNKNLVVLDTRRRMHDIIYNSIYTNY